MKPKRAPREKPIRYEWFEEPASDAGVVVCGIRPRDKTRKLKFEYSVRVVDGRVSLADLRGMAETLLHSGPHASGQQRGGGVRGEAIRESRPLFDTYTDAASAWIAAGMKPSDLQQKNGVKRKFNGDHVKRGIDLFDLRREQLALVAECRLSRGVDWTDPRKRHLHPSLNKYQRQWLADLQAANLLPSPGGKQRAEDNAARMRALKAHWNKRFEK